MHHVEPCVALRYEASYTFFEASCTEDSPWKRELFGFLRPMVLASSIFTSLCRTVVEAPIEQAKVMRQTGRPWEWSTLYRGVTAQTARTTAMLVAIFVPYDVRPSGVADRKRHRSPDAEYTCTRSTLAARRSPLPATPRASGGAAQDTTLRYADRPVLRGDVGLCLRVCTRVATGDDQELRASRIAQAGRQPCRAASLPRWPARAVPWGWARHRVRRPAQRLRDAGDERLGQPPHHEAGAS